MQTRQAELNETEFTASAGGGVVKATVYGSKTVKSIEIAKEAVDPDDVEMLSDLICAAVNEALSIADKTVEEEMQKITGNMNLPNIF